MKETVPYSLNATIVKIFNVFDSPEHNFDSGATKRIGWPDFCYSKPLAKFKRNPKRNVACRLNTIKSLRTHVSGPTHKTIHEDVFIGFGEFANTNRQKNAPKNITFLKKIINQFSIYLDFLQVSVLESISNLNN